MQPVKQNSELLVMTFATFHTVLFVVFITWFIYLFGNLPGLLRNLNTVLLVALFCAFWASTWHTTREGWRRLNWTIEEPPNYRMMFSIGVVWGGKNGMYLLGEMIFILIVASFFGISPTGVTNTNDALLMQVFCWIPFGVGGCGLPFAYVFGLLVGGITACIDAVLPKRILADSRCQYLTIRNHKTTRSKS